MKIKPDYNFSVLREDVFQEKMSAIMQQLIQCRKAGNFAGFDGASLYYEYFLAENSRGAVVILHGLSEFTEKYYELAWYFLNQGYDVFLYDQRSHGRSCRFTERLDMIHVDHFSDYRKDLHRFISDVVRPVTDGPLYLYAHSMGGAVAAQYLAEHPDVFEKAVLSAPMIMPKTGGIPLPLARFAMTLHVLMGYGKRKSWTAKEFDPNFSFDRAHDRSYARFTWNMERRHKNPCYCTTPQTIRWVEQSISLRSRLTSKKYLEKIQTPLLIISAEKDGTVCAKAQQKFAERCPACERFVQKEATHAMLSGTEKTIEEHVQLVLNHFA